MEMTSMETQCGLICLLGTFTKNKVMSTCYCNHSNCSDWHFYVIVVSICKSKLISLLLCNSHILLKIQCHPMQIQNQQTPFKILLAYKNLMCIINNPHSPLCPQHIVLALQVEERLWNSSQNLKYGLSNISKICDGKEKS